MRCVCWGGIELFLIFQNVLERNFSGALKVFDARLAVLAFQTRLQAACLLPFRDFCFVRQSSTFAEANL